MRRRKLTLSGKSKLAANKPVKFSLQLRLADTTVVSERVWVQVAAEGTFNGYAGGEHPFVFDKATFDKLVTNFRAHPSFKAGADGFGASDVVAWDFHHASEMRATEGTLPVTGAPAQGWIHDLAVRESESGATELWALTKWLEPAKQYVKDQRYQWASVSVVFDAIDPRSGANVGPVLTSVALTNTPFIEGMQRLAADRYHCGTWVEPAKSVEHAIEMLRSILGLPGTADLAVILGELGKVKSWALSGTQPLGVDLDDIVGGLRMILNLPALSSNEEVFTEVDKLTARLQEESGVSQPGTAGQTPTPPAGIVTPPAAGATTTPPAPAGTLEKSNMDLLALLAEKFGIVAKPELVAAEVEKLLELREAAGTKLGLEKASTTKVVLKATLDDAGVRAKYEPLLEALGVADPKAALDKIATMMSDSAKLAEMAPEFAALKVKAAETEAKEEEEDVEAAVASTGIAASSAQYGGLKIALATLRKHDKKKFDETYPKATLDKNRKTLAKTGTQPDILQVMLTGGGKTGPSTPLNDQPGGNGATDVSAYEGANVILKTVNFVRATVKGAETWSWDKTHQHAAELVRKGVTVIPS
jgi:hypothetical protein